MGKNAEKSHKKEKGEKNQKQQKQKKKRNVSESVRSSVRGSENNQDEQESSALLQAIRLNKTKRKL